VVGNLWRKLLEIEEVEKNVLPGRMGFSGAEKARVEQRQLRCFVPFNIIGKS
jgi:hypothetical protein